MMKLARHTMVRRLAPLVAALAIGITGLPATAGSVADTVVPAYGIITISDPGTGPRATWTYDGLFDCSLSITGPAGAASSATVTCTLSQNAGSTRFDCPLMIVSRQTPSVVGARASCESTLDMGVGTAGAASANLGFVNYAIVCEAYSFGVLVPPYTVSCDEPGLPDALSSLIPKVTG